MIEIHTLESNWMVMLLSFSLSLSLVFFFWANGIRRWSELSSSRCSTRTYVKKKSKHILFGSAMLFIYEYFFQLVQNHNHKCEKRHQIFNSFQKRKEKKNKLILLRSDQLQLMILHELMIHYRSTESNNSLDMKFVVIHRTKLIHTY